MRLEIEVRVSINLFFFHESHNTPKGQNNKPEVNNRVWNTMSNKSHFNL